MHSLFSGNTAARIALPLLCAAIIVSVAFFLTVSAGAAPPAPGSGATRVFNRPESVLERFRSYKGEKNRLILGNMFRRSDATFTQDPPILLADGTARARITIRGPTSGDQSPTFLVSGGQCVDLRQQDNGVWSLDIMPDRGSYATSVTILTESSMVEYPLAVAPPWNIFDAKKADPVLIDYVTIANELAAQPKR